jgi:hypothetical protein
MNGYERFRAVPGNAPSSPISHDFHFCSENRGYCRRAEANKERGLDRAEFRFEPKATNLDVSTTWLLV